jgi:hypothetical protein
MLPHELVAHKSRMYKGMSLVVINVEFFTRTNILHVVIWFQAEMLVDVQSSPSAGSRSHQNDL